MQRFNRLVCLSVKKIIMRSLVNFLFLEYGIIKPEIKNPKPLHAFAGLFFYFLIINHVYCLDKSKFTKSKT